MLLKPVKEKVLPKNSNILGDPSNPFVQMYTNPANAKPVAASKGVAKQPALAPAAGGPIVKAPPKPAPPAIVSAAPAPPPPVVQPTPAPAPVDQSSDFQSMLDAIMSTQMQGGYGGQASAPDLSGAMAALQTAYGNVQQPTSIMDQLSSLLGNGPELPQMDINKEAQNQINSKYLPQEQALQTQGTKLAQQYGQGVNEQQLYGSKADAALQQIFAALANDLGGARDRTAGYYDQAQGQVGGSYDEASQALANLNQGVMGQLRQSAGDLGIEAGLGSPTSRIMQGYQTAQTGNIQNKAISQAGLGTSRANQSALMEDMIGGSARQGATARSDVASQVQAALAQLGLANARGQSDILGQETALARQKPMDLQSAITALTQSQYEQQRQAQADRLAQITGLGDLDIKNQQLQMSGQNQQLDLAKAMADLQGKQATASSDFALKQQAQQGTPLDQLLKMMQAQNYQTTSDLNKTRMDQLVNPPVKSGTPRPELLTQFLNTPQEGLWGTQAGPNFSSIFSGTDPSTNIILDAQQQAKLTGVDPYTYATSLVNDPERVPAFLNKQGVMKALQLFFRGQ